MAIYGQDWASYQTAAPDTAGLSFAFVKVTEGLSYVNPEWTAQRDHAKAAGLVWGGYHYPHMGNSVQAEADFFLGQVDWQPGDLVVLDWEGYDAANKAVPRAAQAAYKDAWLKYVKQRLPHNPVGMYANVDYWRNVDTSGFYGDFLWIATAGRAAGDPGIQADWLFHQYSDSPVDSDYCRLGSVAELRSWALSFAPGYVPEEGDMLDQQTIDSWNSMIWGLKHTCEATQSQVSSLQAQVAAQQAAITTLAGLVSAQHAGVDTAQVVAAVQAAISAAVVKVQVDVTGPAQPPAGQ